jgi:hypothetical protein
MYENGKTRHVETIPGMGENDGGGKFSYDILSKLRIGGTSST